VSNVDELKAAELAPNSIAKQALPVTRERTTVRMGSAIGDLGSESHAQISTQGAETVAGPGVALRGVIEDRPGTAEYREALESFGRGRRYGSRVDYNLVRGHIYFQGKHRHGTAALERVGVIGGARREVVRGVWALAEAVDAVKGGNPGCTDGRWKAGHLGQRRPLGLGPELGPQDD
jgi:hypothetical protein